MMTRATWWLLVIFGSFCSIVHAQDADIKWVTIVAPGTPLPSNLLLGGVDHDSHMGQTNWPLYVCRVPMHNGMHPGKLLNGNCNVSYAGSGAQYQYFQVATLSGGPGHWGAFDPSKTADMVVGGHDDQGTELYICHANYIYKSYAMFGFIAPSDHDTGVHPGKYISGHCDVEWGAAELELTTNMEVFYKTPPPPPPPPVIATCGTGGKHPCLGPGSVTSTWANQSPYTLDVYVVNVPIGSPLPLAHTTLGCSSYVLVKTLNNGGATWSYTVLKGQIASIEFFLQGYNPCNTAGERAYLSMGWNENYQAVNPPVPIF